jgi:5-methylthioadenosine/S-adenosylhomocysteine deaminase
VSERIDALIHARWTLDVDPDVRAEQGVAVAVDSGRIVAVLPVAEAMARFAPDVLHERPEHVLMPGLINAHCHAGMALFRGFADDLPLEQWLKDRIWPAESRWISQEFVADGTELAIAEMLLGGTTCFSDMYYFPDVVAEVALRTGMRAVVGMIALEFATPWASTVDEYISKGLDVHDRYGPDPLITTTFAPHAPYSVSDSTLKRIRQLADELEVPVHTHFHETATEVAEAVATDGRRPLARLDSLGLVNPALVGVHATQLEPDEIELLGRARASVVHCPRSNLKLASGACPVAALLDAGVNVALGTDGAASNNRIDMFAELQTAALLGKLVAGNASAVPAASALKMATINAARALNLESETGSITVGKAADLICVRLSDPGQLPVLNPISQLVYSASREHVRDVWINGEHLVSSGDLVRMDRSALQRSAHGWAERLLAQ